MTIERGPVDEVARSMIANHMDDCGRRYEALDANIDRRFVGNELVQAARHAENVRRLDTQDRALANISKLLWGVASSFVATLIAVVWQLAHNGGHL